MWTVLLTFDAQDAHSLVPAICYNRKEPLLLSCLADAEHWKEQLTQTNPGCEYEVYQLTKVE